MRPAYRYLDGRFWERVSGVWTEVPRLRMRWLVAHHREAGRSLPVGSEAEEEHLRLYGEACHAMSLDRAQRDRDEPSTGRDLLRLFSEMPTHQIEAALAVKGV